MKLLPLAVNVKAAPPAVPPAGDSDVIVGTGLTLLIVKVAPLEVPPPGAGLTTVTLAVPAPATRAAETWAVSFVALAYVVGRAAPFHFTTDVAIKLLALRV